MQDLSGLLPGDPISALTPSSMAGGNQPHQNRAMTAPGGDPAAMDPSFAGEPNIQPAPDVAAIDVPRTTVTRGDAAGLRGGKPVLRMGEWNDLR